MLRKKKSKRATSDDVNCIFIFMTVAIPGVSGGDARHRRRYGTDIRTGMLLDSI
jgi:hypothetical protein